MYVWCRNITICTSLPPQREAMETTTHAEYLRPVSAREHDELKLMLLQNDFGLSDRCIDRVREFARALEGEPEDIRQARTIRSGRMDGLTATYDGRSELSRISFSLDWEGEEHPYEFLVRDLRNTILELVMDAPTGQLSMKEERSDPHRYRNFTSGDRYQRMQSNILGEDHHGMETVMAYTVFEDAKTYGNSNKDISLFMVTCCNFGMDHMSRRSSKDVWAYKPIPKINKSEKETPEGKQYMANFELTITKIIVLLINAAEEQPTALDILGSTWIVYLALSHVRGVNTYYFRACHGICHPLT